MKGWQRHTHLSSRKGRGMDIKDRTVVEKDRWESWRSKLMTQSKKPAHMKHKGEEKEVPITHLSSMSGCQCYFKSGRVVSLTLPPLNFLPGGRSHSGRNLKAHKGQCVTNVMAASCLAGYPHVLRVVRVLNGCAVTVCQAGFYLHLYCLSF